MNWFGVMPAITTPFTADLAVDHEFLSRHAAWLLENGCQGLVALGSLGEGATLEHAEKIAILKTTVSFAGERYSGRSSDLGAFNLSRGPARQGCRAGGLRRPHGASALRLHIGLA